MTEEERIKVNSITCHHTARFYLPSTSRRNASSWKKRVSWALLTALQAEADEQDRRYKEVKRSRDRPRFHIKYYFYWVTFQTKFRVNLNSHSGLRTVSLLMLLNDDRCMTVPGLVTTTVIWWHWHRDVYICTCKLIAARDGPEVRMDRRQMSCQHVTTRSSRSPRSGWRSLHLISLAYGPRALRPAR